MFFLIQQPSDIKMTVLFVRTTNPKCIALHIKPPSREKIVLWENMSELALYSFPYRHWIKNTISLFASKTCHFPLVRWAIGTSQEIGCFSELRFVPFFSFNSD